MLDDNISRKYMGVHQLFMVKNDGAGGKSVDTKNKNNTQVGDYC